MVDAAPHHEPERLEADLLHEEELVHREVAREELVLPHLLETLASVLRAGLGPTDGERALGCTVAPGRYEGALGASHGPPQRRNGQCWAKNDDSACGGPRVLVRVGGEGGGDHLDPVIERVRRGLQRDAAHEVFVLREDAVRLALRDEHVGGEVELDGDDLGAGRWIFVRSATAVSSMCASRWQERASRSTDRAASRRRSARASTATCTSAPQYLQPYVRPSTPGSIGAPQRSHVTISLFTLPE